MKDLIEFIACMMLVFIFSCTMIDFIFDPHNNEIRTIILGIFIVVVNMLVNKFNHHELVKKD